MFAAFKSPGYKGIIPPYVVLTRPQGRFSEEGFLGPKYKPFATGGDPNASRFEVEGVVARGISDERQKARRDLLEKMNTMGRLMAASPQLAAAEESKNAAYDLILGSGKEVFDLSKEDPKLRDRYGRHTFGQDCLVARRWSRRASLCGDQLSWRLGHAQKSLCDDARQAQLDQGLASLLLDLHERGLLEARSSGAAANLAAARR